MHTGLTLLAWHRPSSRLRLHPYQGPPAMLISSTVSLDSCLTDALITITSVISLQSAAVVTGELTSYSMMTAASYLEFHQPRVPLWDTRLIDLRYTNHNILTLFLLS